MKKRLMYGFLLISLICMNAMTVFAAGTEEYGPGIDWMPVILIPVIVAGIICFTLYKNMKSVYQAQSAKRYEKENSFNLKDKTDTYTHTTTEVIHHDEIENVVDN